MVTANLLGIDYGRERIGLALAGSEAPHGLSTLQNNQEVLAQLASIIEREAVEVAVLGLPRSSSGDDTPWTVEVRQFGANLTAAVRAKVVLQDEFGSTSEAKARLDSRQVPPAEQKGLIDQEVAVILLEDYRNAV